MNLSDTVTAGLLQFLFYTVLVLGMLGLAVLATANSRRIARWLVRVNRVVPGQDVGEANREQTLTRLYASLISVMAFLLVIVGILRLFVDPSQIVWIIGLFSAGFGLGARVLVADLIAGATYIFRNTFSIGEKVEFTVGMNKIEGMVEDVTMRASLVRAPTGELYTVPNGEIGIIRNFTRSQYSGAVIKLKIPTAQLTTAVDTLQALGQRAPSIFPDLLEPWQVLITDEQVGETIEVSVSAHYAFSRAAPMKPALVAAIETELRQAGVRLDGVAAESTPA